MSLSSYPAAERVVISVLVAPLFRLEAVGISKGGDFFSGLALVILPLSESAMELAKRLRLGLRSSQLLGVEVNEPLSARGWLSARISYRGEGMENKLLAIEVWKVVEALTGST